MTKNILAAVFGAILGSVALAQAANTTVLNGLFYTWPAAHAAKALANDGSGTLSWGGDVDTGVPAGLIGFYASTSCPTGWAPLGYYGRYVVAQDSGITGTYGTALSSGENRPAGQHDHAGSSLTASITDSAHGHSTSDPGHTHTNIIGEATASTNEGTGGAYTQGYATNSQTTGISIGNANANISASANLAITGVSGGVAGTNAPYIQLLACQKS